MISCRALLPNMRLKAGGARRLWWNCVCESESSAPQLKRISLGGSYHVRPNPT